MAPHTGQPRDLLDPPSEPSAVPAPRHRDAFAGLLPPFSPAFDEEDVSDKPLGIQTRPRIGPGKTLTLWETWQQRREALLAVDEGVAPDRRRDAGLRRAAETRWSCSPPTTAS